MPRITKQTVDALTPNGADQFLWDEGDGALKGFGVRMKKSGVASSCVQYRNSAGQSRRMTIGRVGTLTPAQARELASAKLREVAEGGDPAEAKAEARREMTIGELCDWYITEAAFGRIVGRAGHPIKGVKQDAAGKPVLIDGKPVLVSTLAMDQSRIDCHVKPLIGHRPLSWLKGDAALERMAQFQKDVAAGKTAKARKATGRGGKLTGGRGAAGRTVRMLNAILAHGQRDGKGCAPARGVRVYADNKCEIFLTIPELVAFGAAMREAAEKGASRAGLAAIRGLLLTGTRKSELCGLPRNRFHPQVKGLQLADSKTVRMRPLGDAAVEHLAEQPHTASPWLFPADNGDGHVTDPRALIEKLLAMAKIDKHVTPHVFRHTFGSIATGLGYSTLIIKSLIGHAKRGATETYAHVPDPASIAAADRVSAVIADALDGLITEAPLAAPVAEAPIGAPALAA
jgi:integrase